MGGPLAMVSSRWEAFRSYIYDTIIVAVTSVWYREFIVTCAPGSEILDVGIGTATSLVANRDLVVSKKLKFHGVDYDQGYIDFANNLVKKHNLSEQVSLECASIHDFRLPAGCPGYDAIYFSGSFMIIPDKEKALKSVVGMLKNKKTGRVCFTQTFERPGIVGFIMSLTKPFFKYILTIDFGSVTYEDDFRRTLRDGGVAVESLQVISKTYFRRQVLVVGRPIVEE